MMGQPLTVGTAGHVDHGKTELVRALTGVDTDRLPEEKARGLTIALGYAPLQLPGGRLLSLIDVPGHERLVRVMVAGATGIDLFLLAIAADDGVMPQTIEHLSVLRSIGVGDGVVAITKVDLADPGDAQRAASALLPGVEIVPCSARTGVGIERLQAALERAAECVPSRATLGGAAVQHIDRVFTIPGAGTVVTGTLWSGAITRGDRLLLFPYGREVRVRSVQVHDRAVARAEAGQRVAVNLAGVHRNIAKRGDVLAVSDAPLHVTHRVDAELVLTEPPPARVQVHHGTRETAARAKALDANLWRIRCEHALIAANGDRLVIRRINPPGTLGGGTIVEAGPRRTAMREQLRPSPTPIAPLEGPCLALEQRLLAAGVKPPTTAQLGDAARYLSNLRAHGRATRVGRSMYTHPTIISYVRGRVERLVATDGWVTLARLRDDLKTSRRHAQAFLEHLDAARVTRELPDHRRVLRKSAG